MEIPILQGCLYPAFWLVIVRYSCLKKSGNFFEYLQCVMWFRCLRQHFFELFLTLYDLRHRRHATLHFDVHDGIFYYNRISVTIWSEWFHGKSDGTMGKVGNRGRWSTSNHRWTYYTIRLTKYWILNLQLPILREVSPFYRISECVNILIAYSLNLCY